MAEPPAYHSAADSGIEIPADRIPRHVAIIMDGNNRWAKKRHLPGIAGHRAGVEAVRKVIEACSEYGIRVLTLFAFSSENWKRPADEVSALMDLFLRALQREVRKLHRHHIRLKVIGDVSSFSPAIQKRIREAEALTAENARVTLVIAASYGGQWDIVQAAQKLAEAVKHGELSPEDITEDRFEAALSTGELPSPDLLIRTSGEHRISNFLLWQCAYSELYFSDLLWPDFGPEEFHRAIVDYSQRQRRYGKTSEQLEAESTC
ncbi:MAG: di-trans,poly-cis-decaprenylcistransferase [Oceanospirillales bacterium LUC14_002_19_P2]|nr:MAG: di-trans,poly-cis-decaprenylcistransferase [Oceanospirillales bacterium LUC14_002_19_P2]